MVEKEPTPIENRLDRTPYAAFGWLGAVSIIFLLMGFLVLWQIAGFLKSRSWLRLPNTTGNLGKQPDIIDQKLREGSNKLQDKAAASVNEALENAQDKLKQSAEEAVKDSLRQTGQDLIDIPGSR